MSEDVKRRPPVRRGERIELLIEDLAFGGAGVARVEGYTIFVRNGLPGQRVRACITKRKSSWAEARLDEVLERSPLEIPARCGHFGTCGGCAWQTLAYDQQLAAKATQVEDCLRRIGGVEDPPMQPPVGAIEPFGYRNKMEFSFADRVWHDTPPPKAEPGEPRRSRPAEFGCGLHPRGQFSSVINLTECHLVRPWAIAALTAAREAAAPSGFAPYSTRTHTGLFRFLVLREGFQTGEKMATLVTTPASPESDEGRAVAEVLHAVREAVPDITTLVHGMTSSKANVAFCESHRPFHGPGVIRERLLDDSFEIGPNTFFQTNPLQAEKLFRTALDLAGGPAKLAYDLYCGVGALTLPLSHLAGRVVGAEIIEASVDAGRQNARLSGRDNITFVAGDLKSLISADGLCGDDGVMIAGRPDLVMVDPPRDGLHADVTGAILDLAPDRLVYVSCNPSTLARDTKLFVAGGYRLTKVVPVDMFPQTAHVEVVAGFVRAGAVSD